MAVENPVSLNFAPQILECLLANGVIKVEFAAPISEGLLEKPIFQKIEIIISELTDNCQEKGAKEIKITLNNNSLRIEDDVVEDDPEKTLKLLNKILETGEKTTTKDAMRVAAGCSPGGGVGIAEIVLGSLKNVGGKLEYLIEGGRIVAIATWP